MQFLKRLAILGWALLLAASVSLAQSTFATITGSVTDPAGALIPGVNIEVTHLETNYVYNTQSNEAGQYTVASVREGTYRLQATSEGFQTYVVDDIVITAADVRRVDVTMELGTVATTIEVSGGVTLIETETARIADTKDREVLRAMPLTLRRAWDYFTQTPQVERTGQWHVRFAGSRNNQGEANIDGTTITGAGGGTAIGPLMDRTEFLQELRIDMAQGSADQATMGQVTMISRAGTNDLHGAWSDYYSTPAFKARNPFNNAVSSQRTHQMVFSLGGPVYIPKIYNGKNKTFFFHTTEIGFRSASTVSYLRTVPLSAWRGGDFSGVGDPITDPFNGNTPFPNNMIPSSRINPTSSKFQDRFYVQPNFGDPDVLVANNYRDQRPGNSPHQPTITTRIDHRFSDRAFVFGRWTAVRWNLSGPMTTLPTTSEWEFRRRDMDAFTAGYTHTFSPTVMNEFRFGISSQRFPNEAPIMGNEVVSDLGLQGLAPGIPDVGGVPWVDFSGIGLSRIEVRASCNPCGENWTNSFYDHVTWFKGNHSLKIGGELRRSLYTQRREGNELFSHTSFSQRFTGHPYADFLLGTPSTLRRAFPDIGVDRIRYNFAGFVTDEWKVRPDLTLTMGFRWDLMDPWNESNGLLALFDIGTGSIVVPDDSLSSVSPLMPTGYVDVVSASSVGRPQKLISADKNNFQPRFGFAWRPFGNNTVIRGGYGIYFDQSPRTPSMAGIPFKISEPAFTNPVDNPILWPQAFPSTGSGGPSTVSLPSGIQSDIRIPYSMQYNFTIEHRIWDTGFRATYNGTNTRQGVWRHDYNQPYVDGNLYIDKARQFPQYPTINYDGNGAGHQYHALTTEVERRMKGGVHFQVHWTWARDIGDLENGQSPEDAHNRLRERAVWERLPTHRFGGNFIYQLPMGAGKPLSSDKRWVNEVIGGWEITGIFALESGRFVNPQWRGPDPTGTRFTSSATRPIVTIRPDHLASADISNPTVEKWFNTDAFGAPAIGAFGTAAKGTIRGAPTEVLHAGIAKIFLIKERLRLRLEGLATNVFNHPNYQDPQTRLDQAGTYGRITNVINRNLKFDSAIPREIQLQLRVEW